MKTRLFIVVLLLVIARLRGEAQANNDANEEVQVWPDVTLGLKLSPNVTLNLFGTARFGQHQGNWVAEQLGTAVIFRISKYLSISPHYRHIWSQPDIARQTQENRYFLDVTPRLPLPRGFALQDRSRLEFRDIEDRASWRYRNRLQLEKDYTWHEHPVTSYLAGEFFYDSRPHQWNRKQFWAGTRLPVSKHLTLDFHYARILDAQARPGNLHIVGVFSRFEF